MGADDAHPKDPAQKWYTPLNSLYYQLDTASIGDEAGVDAASLLCYSTPALHVQSAIAYRTHALSNRSWTDRAELGVVSVCPLPAACPIAQANAELAKKAEVAMTDFKQFVTKHKKGALSDPGEIAQFGCLSREGSGLGEAPGVP